MKRQTFAAWPEWDDTEHVQEDDVHVSPGRRIELLPLAVERALRWIPLEDGFYMLARVLTNAQVPPLVVRQGVILRVERQIFHAGEGIAFGLLCGAPYLDPASEMEYLLVEEVVPAAQIPDGPDAESAIIAELSARLLALEQSGRHVLGWYRSHADLVPGISRRLAGMHRTIFPHPWQVALLRGAGKSISAGAFMRVEPGEGRPYSMPFFELMPRVLEHGASVLPTSVRWTNYRPAIRCVPLPDSNFCDEDSQELQLDPAPQAPVASSHPFRRLAEKLLGGGKPSNRLRAMPGDAGTSSGDGYTARLRPTEELQLNADEPAASSAPSAPVQWRPSKAIPADFAPPSAAPAPSSPAPEPAIQSPEARMATEVSGSDHKQTPTVPASAALTSAVEEVSAKHTRRTQGGQRGGARKRNTRVRRPTPPPANACTTQPDGPPIPASPVKGDSMASHDTSHDTSHERPQQVAEVVHQVPNQLSLHSEASERDVTPVVLAPMAEPHPNADAVPASLPPRLEIIQPQISVTTPPEPFSTPVKIRVATSAEPTVQPSHPPVGQKAIVALADRTAQHATAEEECPDVVWLPPERPGVMAASPATGNFWRLVIAAVVGALVLFGVRQLRAPVPDRPSFGTTTSLEGAAKQTPGVSDNTGGPTASSTENEQQNRTDSAVVRFQLSRIGDLTAALSSDIARFDSASTSARSLGVADREDACALAQYAREQAIMDQAAIAFARKQLSQGIDLRQAALVQSLAARITGTSSTLRSIGCAVSAP